MFSFSSFFCALARAVHTYVYSFVVVLVVVVLRAL